MYQGQYFLFHRIYHCFIVSADSKSTSYELTNQNSTESSVSVVQMEVSLLDDLPEEENVKEIVPKSEVKKLKTHSICHINPP